MQADRLTLIGRATAKAAVRTTLKGYKGAPAGVKLGALQAKRHTSPMTAQKLARSQSGGGAQLLSKLLQCLGKGTVSR